MRAATLERAERMIGMEMSRVVDAALDAMYPPPLRGPEFATHHARFLANDPVAFAHATRAFAESDVALEQLRTRSLLLAGDLDVRPVEAIRALLQRLPDATLEVVANAGHMMAQQAPKAIAQRIVAFLA